MKLLKSLQNCTLHPHQIEGVQWLIEHWSLHQNVIVADEMGLGKTLQSLAFFCYLIEENLSNGPFLVIAPLSVAPQWETQAEKFVPSLKTLLYLGTGEERVEMRRCTVENRADQNAPFDLLVTSYETCVSDIEFVSGFPWRTIVFDEGHRLKNPQGKTHATLLERLHADFKMILTGTPVQNNVTEFWALLRFLNPEKFPESTRSGTVSRISEFVNTYVLRRLFSATSSISLPPIDQLVIRTEMTSIQTDLYRWALFHYAKSTCGASEVPAGILSNLMMTLRKIASHPYLIGGVEPEPFSEGPHIWMNSNKFRILRLLLSKMRNEESKCLIFSNFTSLLDICQDFLDLEGISYERLDGSVRNEERTEAINRFSSDAVEKKKVFLLSTRAGGVGLNLTAANWVIFLDTDWNPQMDLQAIARSFRQGQEKRVKVFRLITRGTVDEVIFARALEKLKFANKILNDEDTDVSPRDMKELILRGISQLQGSQDPAGPMPRASREKVASADEEDIENLIESLDEEEEGELLVVVGGGDDQHNYKKFEGVDYSVLKSADIDAMDRLTARATTSTTLGNRSLSVNGTRESAHLVSRIQQMTQENRLKRKLEKWNQIGYSSFALENVGDFISPDPSVPSGEIVHLHGSFVQLENKKNNQVHVVVHVVDSSGIWPTSSRLFMAVANAFPAVPKYYYQAKKAADLRLGDLHLIPITGESLFVALCVCKTADVNFETCLRKLSNRFDRSTSTVNIHFSRIGDQRGTLYITERLIGKYLCAFGFNAFIYYYKAEKKSTIFDYFKKSSDEKNFSSSKSPLVTVYFSPLILPVLREVYAKDITAIGGSAVHAPPADIYVVSVKEGKEGIDNIAKSLAVPVETSIPETPLRSEDSLVRIILTTQLEHVLLQKRNSSYH